MTTPGRRVIYIKNPTDGKSHFRTIGGMGGGGTNRTHKWGPGSLFDILQIPYYADYIQNGPGINYQQGTWTGTGGAIYSTPPSNWNIRPRQDTNARLTGNGAPGFGPWDPSGMLPPPGFGGARDLKGWELWLATILYGAIGASMSVEGIAAGLSNAYELNSGAHITEAARFQAMLVVGGARAGAPNTLLAAGIGQKPSVYDAPTVSWNKQAGGYVTEYHDLISAIFKGKDYRNKGGIAPATWK